MRVRLPERADHARGPVALRELPEEEGYLGLADTWESNFPEAVPFREARDAANAVWLPTELAARVWQAFVSFDPRTVIQFPTFDGNETYGEVLPRGWHNSCIAAGKSFRVLATGPIGDDVAVDFYADLRKLKRLGGGLYDPVLEPVEPGLHVLYAITKIGGTREISRPALIYFHPTK
jgi:hypothetical protein